jgi:hypothetical protein
MKKELFVFPGSCPWFGKIVPEMIVGAVGGGGLVAAALTFTWQEVLAWMSNVELNGGTVEAVMVADPVMPVVFWLT